MPRQYLGDVFPYQHSSAQGIQKLIKLNKHDFDTIQFIEISYNELPELLMVIKELPQNPPQHRHCPIRQNNNVPHIPLFKLGF